MLYLKPEYYDEFKCLMGACHDTCCRDWEIVIDDASMKRFLKMPGAIGEKVRQSIRTAADGSNVFAARNKNCALLASDGRCSLQLQAGEDALSDICRSFPRHMEEYDSEREYTIDPACEEAARIILTTSKNKIITCEDDLIEESDYDDFDYFLYSTLNMLRENLLDRTYRYLEPGADSVPEVSVLSNSLLSLGKTWQDQIDSDRVFEIDTSAEIVTSAETSADSHPLSLTYENEYRMYKVLYSMEMLRDGYMEKLVAAGDKIFSDEKSWSKYSSQLEKYREPFIRLLRYMILRYMDGASYDYHIMGRMALSVYTSRWVILLFISSDGDPLNSLVQTTHEFFREIIHSDENLALFYDKAESPAP